MNIYVIDNTIDLDPKGNKKSIDNDTGRTKVMRSILKQITYNDTRIRNYNALVQVYTTFVNGTPTFIDLDTPFILFIHTSNDYCEGFLENLLGKNGLESSWIVCYSGGDEPKWYKNLGKNKFQNIRFFERIGDTVEGKWNIPAFVNAVLQGKLDAFDYLIRKHKPHFVALSILCQGYLAAHGGDELKGKLPDELMKIAMKRWSMSNIENTWWDIIMIDKVNDQLQDKEAEDKNKIENLLKGITGKKVTVDIVKAAYGAITRILG